MSFNSAISKTRKEFFDKYKQKIMSFVSEKINQTMPSVLLRDFDKIKQLSIAISYYQVCKLNLEKEKNSMDRLYSNRISDYDTAISDYIFIQKVHLDVYTKAIQQLNNSIAAINIPTNNVLTSLITALVDENEAFIQTIDAKIEDLKKLKQEQYDALNDQVTAGLFGPISTTGSQRERNQVASNLYEDMFEGRVLPRHPPFPLRRNNRENANAWLNSRGLNKQGFPAGPGLKIKIPSSPGRGGKRTRRRRSNRKRTRRSY